MTVNLYWLIMRDHHHYCAPAVKGLIDLINGYPAHSTIMVVCLADDQVLVIMMMRDSLL